MARRPDPRYLGLDEVLALHAHQMAKYGGGLGVRDLGALESALAMPEATFDGKLLHETNFEQAAAYLFHVARNHPFVDGNKRVALATALAFLWLNDWRLEATESELVDFVLDVATGRASKSEVATWLKAHSREDTTRRRPRRPVARPPLSREGPAS